MGTGRVDFERIVALASDAILMLDRHGMIRYANAAAASLFGRSTEALVGADFGFVVIPDEPTEIEIPRAGSVISADMRSVDMIMDGHQVAVVYLRDVTERKVAERAILTHQTRLEEAQRIARLGYWEWQPESGAIWWSDMVYRIFGMEPSDAAPSYDAFYARVHPEDRALVLENEQEAHLTGRLDEEHRIVLPDGTLRWVRQVARAEPDHPDRPRRFHGTVQDVTDDKLAEARLHDRERLIQMAANLARIGGWNVDLIANRATWSDEVCRIHEEPPGTVVRVEDGISYYAPEWRERITRVFTACAREGIGYDEELQIITATGRRVWVRTIGAAVRDISGHITHVQGAFQDITERKTAEERLRLSAAVFENTSEGIIITDTTPAIIAVNPAFTEINGYGPEEVLGRNPSLLKSGKHDPRFYEEMWRGLLDLGHWRGEIWNRRKDGEIYPQWVNINAVRSALGQTTHYVGVFSDLSDVKRSEAQIERLAHRDPLTDLPNRLLFRTRLEQALLRASTSRARVGMLLVDIDGFRHINDSLGHAVGDLALREVAKRLTELVRIDETVARLSGDELAVLIEGDEDIDTRAALMAERIRESLKKPFTVEATELFMSASIGIAIYPEDGSDVSELMQNGDAALYQAREAGGNTYRHYARSLTDYARERVTLTSELNRAIERDELRLHYQPLVDTESCRVNGLEVLVRWQHPERGMVLPDSFIRLAEETGLIIPLGAWVLRSACIQAREWETAGIPFGRIAVNVSGVQIQRSDFARTLESILDETGLGAERLELELTETFVMDLREDAQRLLGDLKRLGIALAMDDFGTGYSSLAYLKGLPFDTLKIDRSFIGGLPDDPASAAIVTAITTLGHSLGFEVLAEGVETEAQRRFLLGVGCRRAQGYLFSPPVPPEAVVRLLS
ncbi:bifunctional diguanylate cyclase/phosphodiesterase [Thiocapsa roseopersicina]|uniref:cyclic-guanylate-specific phosphodiesterase n=1 Tax=Thiocapsa roseopersicina TaxID=1058 RepID=A0A1H2WRT2_THIRO|nr:EAL domain-containing protein [Thiocapsa roseopersicina]SDW83342.1 PAS domain S-box-containing protein/diguanylate cyclase (GGDEF) domain-containing protein [Thiocapsa roseopersicina]